MDATLLHGLGVGEKAAKIYMAGLALGTTSVQELARKSGLKRPTVYLHVDELIKQGLFELVPINKKWYYRATEPQILEDRLKKNLIMWQKELPKLMALRANTMGRPQVQIFEGEEGIKQVYEELKRARTWRVWSNINPELNSLHNTYMEMCEAVKENGIGVREIIADRKETKRYSRLIMKLAGSTYTARTATVEGLANDTIVYDNVAALFRLHGLNMFVVRIEDPTIADSMRAMFEMAWKTARPFR